MSLNSTSKNDGFTLIEMLISMAVLIFISFGIYQATTETYRLRDILSTEGDFYNGVRLAMDILQKDINSIYSPMLIDTTPKPNTLPAGSPPPPPTQLDTEAQSIINSELGQATKFWLGATDRSGIRASHFIGTDSAMSFVAISHLRIYKESPESEVSKISYSLQKDNSFNATPDTMVLIKTENTDAFNGEDLDHKEFTHSYKLLRGITALKFTYYMKDGKSWKTFNSWDNESEDFKKAFPDIIEVDVKVIGPSHLSFEGIYKFRPEAPLRGLDPST